MQILHSPHDPSTRTAVLIQSSSTTDDDNDDPTYTALVFAF